MMFRPKGWGRNGCALLLGNSIKGFPTGKDDGIFGLASCFFSHARVSFSAENKGGLRPSTLELFEKLSKTFAFAVWNFRPCRKARARHLGLKFSSSRARDERNTRPLAGGSEQTARSRGLYKITRKE